MKEQVSVLSNPASCIDIKCSCREVYCVACEENTNLCIHIHEEYKRLKRLKENVKNKIKEYKEKEEEENDDIECKVAYAKIWRVLENLDK
jgi:hypothetical protein